MTNLTKFLTYLLSILALVATGQAASASTKVAPVLQPAVRASISAPANEPNGGFIVEVFNDGAWKKAGRMEFGKYFTGQVVDLSRYAAKGQKARVRLTKQGGGMAHLEAAYLGGAAPSAVLSSTDPLTLKKLTARDNDVADATHGMEMEFPADREGALLLVNGRVEPTVISKEAFKFPPANNYKKIDASSTFYSYKPGTNHHAFGLDDGPAKVNSLEPTFAVWSTPGSGHPANYTYGWVADDGENLYAVVEFASDNTMDGAADYSTLYVKTPAGVKEFRISENVTKWGSNQFVYSQRATYQHKYYTFKIPFSELGAKKNEELALAFDAYGTSSLQNDLSAPTIISYNYGNVKVCSPSFQSAYLYLTAPAAGCTVTGVTMTSAGGDFYIVSITPPTPTTVSTVAPFSVAFEYLPKSSASHTGTVTITSDGANGCLTTFNFALSGTGSPSVGLAPAIGVMAATSITPSGATLNASAAPNGESTATSFQYGPTLAYGTTVAGSPSPVAGCNATNFSAAITGLTCNTFYNFQPMGTNVIGTSFGGNQSFTTLACTAPSATTNAATGASQTSATLNGTVNGWGDATTVTFDYGTTVAYGTTAAAAQSPLAATSGSTAVSLAVGGLTCGVTYHYRVNATNTTATTNGADMTFTILCPPPPAPSGGGGGGGGITNQPPYHPGGGSWLISPDDGGYGNGNTPFVWRVLQDLDGDVITYSLYVCPNGDFENCQVIATFDSQGNQLRMAAGLGVLGAGLLLVGFGFTSGRRRRLAVMAAVLALTGSAAMVACGHSSGSASQGVTVASCSAAGADALCGEKYSLKPGDYQWKVTAEDGRGGVIESEPRGFTVK
ncbi:MAG: hypothetical protein OEV92_04745 [Nitrospinota bacterium]|nr:hypothetical protein [Nitrospinota bacterium]